MIPSSDVVIRVEGLGKKYTISHEHVDSYRTLRDSLTQRGIALRRWANPFTLAGQLRNAKRSAKQKHNKEQEDFWALKDVSFEIRRGDRVGIIGRNGAGKSTLLKVLSRITEPSTGRVEILGRVASLLEVGTGFHPELTGRENIFLNGSILGMTRKEIRSKFDEIVNFAEIDKFLDTPVKRYSSGMYVRLAFSVAAHLEPEILVVDEVLAVGDASFQKKCIGKMQDVADGNGRTVLFVSHNMTAVKQLCNHAISLSNGSIVSQGDPNKIIDDYLGSQESNTPLIEWPHRSSSPGDEAFRIRRIQVDNALHPGAKINIAEPVIVKLFYEMLKPADISMLSIDTSIHLKNAEGLVIFATGNERKLDHFPVNFEDDNPVVLCDTCMIPAHFLNDTNYVIDAYVLTNTNRFHAVVRDSISFSVTEGAREGWPGKIIGVIRPTLTWTSEQLQGSIFPP